MKSPNKNEKDEFICQECNKTYKRLCDMSRHIAVSHNSKEYYDKYLKEDNAEICPICGSPNVYLNRWDRGYSKICSKECSKIQVKQQGEKTKLKKYGDKNFSNPLKTKKTKLEKYGNEIYTNREKSKQTCKEHYGVDYPFQSPEITKKRNKLMMQKYGCKYTLQSAKLVNKMKETNIKKYGSEYAQSNDEIKERIKKSTKKSTGYDYNFQNKELMHSSMLKKYGVKNISQLSETQKKIKKTNLLKYGYEHPMQNKDIFIKAFKTKIKIKQFKDTNIWYQGLYELNFLEKYYDKLIIERGPSIKYKFKRKNKIYYADFYIAPLNLIVEIKNSYLLKRDKYKCLNKKKAAISSGYNYIMIVDKNYKKFEKLFKTS